jgi:hypothetical protein
MIHVSPTELHRAPGLGGILGASPAAGPRSWCHEYLFEYAGGETLTLTATDNRVVLRAHLPVHGRAGPWRAAVEVTRFNHFRHIDGGRMEFGPLGTNHLLVRHGSLRLPFPARVLDPAESGPWPTTAPAEAGEMVIDANTLAACLRVLPTAAGDPASHLMSWFPDGVMVAFEAGLWYRVAGPELPLACDIALKDARRVRGWLNLLLRPPEGPRPGDEERREPRPLTVSFQTAAGGARFIRLTDSASANEALVPLASRSNPRAPLDRAHAADSVAQVTVSRRELRLLAELARGLPVAHPLRCTFAPSGTGGQRLHVVGGPSDDPELLADVSLTDQSPVGPPRGTHELTVLPRRLAFATQRLWPDEVCVRYRPSVNLLGISPAGAAIQPGVPAAEIFLDARPAQAPGAPGPVPVQLPDPAGHPGQG